MTVFLRILAVIVLTVALFFGLAQIDSFARWVGSGAVISTLMPMFRLLGVEGAEETENALICLIATVCLLISLLVVSFATVLSKKST